MRATQDGLSRSAPRSDGELGLLDGDQTLVQQTEQSVSERFNSTAVDAPLPAQNLKSLEKC
uniref:Uncharacterized protein n=1 Tax=Oryza nivara TaxID=4536 RepID=A0A0E0GGD9_ORYNI